MTDSEHETLPTAGLLRRLGAIVYDTLLLAALLLVAGFIPLLFIGAEPLGGAKPFFQTYMFIIIFMFFAWFWTHGGQTLGMRAWRLRIQNEQGISISWTQSLLRFMCGMVSWGALGLGFLWILIDPKKLAWHDRFSNSRVVVLPKQS